MSILTIPALVRGRHIWDGYRIPPDEFERRWNRVREVMRAERLSGLALYSDSLSNGYVGYLTYYDCVITWSNALLLFPVEGEPLLVASVPPRDAARVKGFTPPITRYEFAGLSLVANDHIGARGAEFIADYGGKWAGVNLDAMPWKAALDLEGSHGPIGDFTTRYDLIRSRKVRLEASLMGEAAGIAKRAAINLARLCVPGATERQAVYAADRQARYDGAEDVQILTSGAGGLGHLHFAGDTPFSRGELVSVYCQVQYLRYQGVYGFSFRVGQAGAGGELALAQTARKLALVKSDLEASGFLRADYRTVYGLEPESISGINGIGMDQVEMPATLEGDWRLEEGNVINITLDERRSEGGALMSKSFLFVGGRLWPISGA